MNCIVSYERSKAKSTNPNASKRCLRDCNTHRCFLESYLCWYSLSLVPLCSGLVQLMSSNSGLLSNSLGTTVKASRCCLREGRPRESGSHKGSCIYMKFWVRGF